MKLRLFPGKTITMIALVLIISFATVAADASAPMAEDLIKKAGTNGMVPVIIKLKVPRIQYLTADCIRHTSRSRDPREQQASWDSDLRLETAIQVVSDEVLFELKNSGYVLNHTFSTLPYLALKANAETLAALVSLPQVESIFEDRLIRIPEYRKVDVDTEEADSPLMADAVRLVRADSAWAAGYTGNGQFVAVLDSGLLRSHEAFAGKTIIEQCYSLRADCANGQISMSGPGSAGLYDSRYYGHDHGTHVSGIAVGNNGGSFRGIAPDANLIFIKVFSRFTAAECGSNEPCVMSYNSDQLKGLEFVFSKRNQLRISSVNLSLGGGEYSSAAACDRDNPSMKTAIDNLKAAGIATVISAGNEALCNGISAPACISSAISVGATTKQDTEASFSNFHHEMLDLFAPGQSINSATGDDNSSYQRWGGTSMAAPMLAGAFAIFRQFSRDVLQEDLMTALEYYGRPVVTKCNTGVEKPRINVGDALMSLMKLAPPVNIQGSQSSNQSMFQREYINTLTWEANPLNAEKNVVFYRIYLMDGDIMTRIGEVDAATFIYNHRRVAKRAEMTYALTSVDGEGEESGPSLFDLEFGVEQ